MASFRDGQNFESELAIRTQLNYYYLRLQEIEKDIENKVDRSGNIKPDGYNDSLKKEREEINKKVSLLHDFMEQNEYKLLNFCSGTQLMNSVLGLLIFPFERNKNSISRWTREEKWRKVFPVLSKYLFSSDSNRFSSTYMKDGRREVLSPENVLRHMRNAVGHDHITFYPVQDENNGGVDEVTDIVFKDNYYDQSFYLKLRKDDFDIVLLEISSYLIYIKQIKELDRFYADWHRDCDTSFYEWLISDKVKRRIRNAKT